MKKVVIAVLMVSILLSSVMVALAKNGDKYDLSNFGYRYVDSKGRGSLVFQQSPRGKSMKGHKFYTGDKIYVNLHWRQDDYGIAYEDGEYGYVDASYIDWGSSSGQSSGGMSSSDKNLSNFAYRKVSSKGRGSLVFQKSPRGKSMSGHKFYDGDWIYVNVNYRKDGYSIAYEDGEYGYVDASYIDWDSRKGSSSSSPSSKPSSKPSSSPSSGGNGNVTFTGNVNVRSGPGIDYSIIGEVSSNQSLSYAGSTRNDDRGVAWYSVDYYGRTGWVSSKYSKRGNGQKSSSQKKLNNDVQEVLDLFDICALTVEYPGENSSEGHLCRWEQSIRIYVDGNPRNKDTEIIEQFISQLASNVAGLPDISITTIKSRANMFIYFVPQRELGDYVPGYIGSNWGIFNYTTDDNYRITKAIIGVTTDKTNQDNRNHIILEEITGALGLPNDHWYSKKSILYQGSSSVQQLSGLDWDMLSILYSPKLKPGMEQDQIHRIVLSGNW